MSGLEQRESQRVLIKWKTNQFSIKKFDNFNRCKVYLELPCPNQMATYLQSNRKSGVDCNEGYTFDFFRDFASSLNFTTHINLLNNYSKKLQNGSLPSDFHIYALHIRSLDFYKSNLVTTHVFTTNNDIILVSRELPYS